jgi:aminoglycoside phosphotransferase (APT) family kinase protein
MTATSVEPVLARACLELLSADAVSSQQLKTGSRSAVYRVALADGRWVIVKVFSDTARCNAISESRVIEAAKGFVPVPAVLGCGPVHGHPATALVTADLGDLTLDGAVKAGRIARQQALEHLGVLLVRFHQIPGTRAGLPVRPFTEHVTWLARRCSTEVMNRLEPALEVMADRCADSGRLMLGHGDLHGDNILIPDRGPAAGLLHVIDFAQSSLCVPEFDVAQTLTVTQAVEPAERQQVIAAYGNGLDEPLVDASVAFHTVRCWAHANLTRDEPSRQQWAARLHRATERTPHLFRTPTPMDERSRW